MVAAAGAVTVTDDPLEAVARADAVATDVWTSMGEEAERDQRVSNLTPYQVNRGCSRQRHRATSCCTPACALRRGDHARGARRPQLAAWDEAETASMPRRR